MSRTETATPLDVLYNGRCPICSREIAAYRRYSEARGLGIRFTDISAADLAALGLTHDAAAKRLHVIDDGKLLSGVPAFGRLWRAMPRMAWAGRMVETPVLGAVAGVIYNRVLAPILYAMHRRREARAGRR